MWLIFDVGRRTPLIRKLFLFLPHGFSRACKYRPGVQLGWAGGRLLEEERGALQHHAARVLGAIARGGASPAGGAGARRGLRMWRLFACGARAVVPGKVLGVDLSAGMLARARERAGEEGLANVRFEQADAQVHPFDEAVFDVIISRYGVMFFADPASAFRNLARSLRPGGRMTLLTWRGLQHNEWIREIRHALSDGQVKPPPPPCAPGPLGFSDPNAVRPILAQAGLGEITFTEVSEPLCYGPDVESAFEFIHGTPLAQDVLAEMAPADQQRAIESLRALLVRHTSVHGVCFQSSAWIVSARRR